MVTQMDSSTCVLHSDSYLMYPLVSPGVVAATETSLFT